MEADSIRNKVREEYGKRVSQGSGCCGPETTTSSCCGSPTKDSISKEVGYSEDELKSIPEDANLGFGCGNPVALASISEGDTVLDLGSGAGIDCFLAANKVGKTGKVIGVDMTSEMIEKARENARKNSYDNVEFRLGEIENLPVPDNSVDLVISNCVINLSPEKPKVFNEIHRVLKTGGKIMVSDIVLTKELPDKVKDSIDAYLGCISGASLEDDYLGAIKNAGFKEVTIENSTEVPADLWANDPIGESIKNEFNATQEEMNNTLSMIKSIKVSALKD